MKTDKNTLFRAIGEIDEKFVSEILEEDASNVSVIKSFDAAKAATSAKKKASGAKKFMMYYLPAVAGLLICAVIVKSFMTSKNSSAGNDAAECATAPMSDEIQTEGACYDAAFDSEAVANMEEAASDYDDMASATSADKPDNGATFGMEDEESMFIDGMPNPFADCETLEEACEIAGVDLVIPDDFGFGFTRIYRAMEGRMIEVIFMDGDTEVYRIRKGLTSKFGEDISGDYNEYSVSTNIDSANYAATLSGNTEDMISLAVWNDDTYSYSVTFEEPVPMVSAIGIIDMIMAQ